MAAVPAMPFAYLREIAWGLRELAGANRYACCEEAQTLRIVIWNTGPGSEDLLGSAEASINEDAFRVRMSAIHGDVSFELPRAVGERMCRLGCPRYKKPH